MKKVLTVSLCLLAGFALGVLSLGLTLHVSAGAGSGADRVATRNGDVNGDGRINIADPVFLLNWLFSHGPDIVPVARVTATGQAECFDEVLLGPQVDCSDKKTAGQDGYYKTGCPVEGRFVDNGDGTVTDTCTGLTWTKNIIDVNGDSKSTREDVLTWNDARHFVDNLTFAGHEDWRVPNALELVGIANFSTGNDPEPPPSGLLPPFEFDPERQISSMWSSTTSRNRGCAYVLSYTMFNCSPLSPQEKGKLGVLMAVRGP